MIKGGPEKEDVMKMEKALALVDSILDVHREALREAHPRCMEVLDNAKSDLVQLVRKIYSDYEDGDPGNDGDADNVKLIQPYRPEDY